MSLAEKIKVLIVDDQVTSRLLLGDALHQLGFKQITAAGDGEQGAKIMAAAAASPGDLGFQHAEDGRPRPSSGRAHQSGDEEGGLHHADRAGRPRAGARRRRQLGANNVLAKPFTIEKMKAAIEAVFGALK